MMHGRGAKTKVPARLDSQSGSPGEPGIHKSPLSDFEICNECKLAVTSEGIACDKCQTWIHPRPACSGLPNTTTKAILNCRGVGVLFIC